MISPEFLTCESVCSPEQRLGCARNVGEIALTLTQKEQFKPETAFEDFTPRDYQLEAWDAIRLVRETGQNKALIHLATGLGKTTVAVVDALRFIYEQNEGQEAFRMPRILFAVHQTEILEQASERFRMFAPHIPQGFYSDGNKNTDAPIVFGTLQSLNENLEDLKPEQFDYIIYDEAHHMQAETYKRVVQHFKPQFQLALTATPDRMDGLDIRELFGKEVYSKNLAEALVEGWLAEVDYHIVIDDAVKEAIATGFEGLSIKGIRELLNNASRNERIADQIRSEIISLGLENAKTILFCHSIQHAEDMAELLGGRAFHSGVDEDQRKLILKNFRSGGINLIATRDMFNEGVDIPDARLVVFLRSTGSRTVFEQQLGRGLRKTPTKSTVTVLDFVANIERLEQLKEFADEIKHIQHEAGLNGTATDEERGEHLVIHSVHGDFDFDKIAVDLLEKIGAIKDRTGKFNSLSNEEIVDLAKQLSPDVALSAQTIDELSAEGSFLSWPTIRKRFGSLFEFQAACGFDTKARLYKMSNDELVELAKDLSPDKALARDDIDALSKQGLFYSSTIIRKRFGSLKNFQELCGQEAPKQAVTKIELTDEQLIDLAKELSPNGPMNINMIRDLSKEGKFVSPSYIGNRFGGLKKFYELCGWLEPGETPQGKMKITEEQVASMVQEHGIRGPLTKKQIVELSTKGQLPSYATISKLFGSIDNFNESLLRTEQF